MSLSHKKCGKALKCEFSSWNSKSDTTIALYLYRVPRIKSVAGGAGAGCESTSLPVLCSCGPAVAVGMKKLREESESRESRATRSSIGSCGASLSLLHAHGVDGGPYYYFIASEQRGWTGSTTARLSGIQDCTG